MTSPCTAFIVALLLLRQLGHTARVGLRNIDSIESNPRDRDVSDNGNSLEPVLPRMLQPRDSFNASFNASDAFFDMPRVLPSTVETDAFNASFNDSDAFLEIPRKLPSTVEQAEELGGFVASASWEFTNMAVETTPEGISHILGINLAAAGALHQAIASVGALMTLHGLYNMATELANATDIDHLTLANLSVDPNNPAGICEVPGDTKGENRLVVELAETTAANILQQLVRDGFSEIVGNDRVRAANMVHAILVGLVARLDKNGGWKQDQDEAYLKCVLAILIGARTKMPYQYPVHFAETQQEQSVIDLTHGNVIALLLGDHEGVGCCSGKTDPWFASSEEICLDTVDECSTQKGNFHFDAICVEGALCFSPLEGGPVLQGLYRIVLSFVGE